MRSAGYVVKTFATGAELLNSDNLKDMDCLILDVQRPGLNGLEIQKMIGTRRANIPIIFITAHHDEDVRQRAMENGAAGFLEKPFDDQALMRLIQKVEKQSQGA